MTKPFDRVMVHVEIAHHLKLRKLTDAERWAFVAGVLPIAAKSEMRGALTVGRAPAEAEDVAHQARVSVRVARSCLDKLRAVGLLERDGEVEWVHDFEQWNPEPKRDETAAQRAREYRRRQKAKRQAAEPTDVTEPSRVTGRGVTGVTPVTITDRHAPEEKRREEETPPLPPKGGDHGSRHGSGIAPDAIAPEKPAGDRQRDQAAYEQQMRSFVAGLFPHDNLEHRVADVSHLVFLMRRDGITPTAEAVREAVHRRDAKIAARADDFRTTIEEASAA